MRRTLDRAAYWSLVIFFSMIIAIPIAFIFIWLIVILSQALWGEGACQGIWC